MSHKIEGNRIRVDQKEGVYWIEDCPELIKHLSDEGCTCEVHLNPFNTDNVYLCGSQNCLAHGHKYQLVKDQAIIQKELSNVGFGEGI